MKTLRFFGMLSGLAAVIWFSGCGESASSVVSQLPGSWQGEMIVNEAGVTGSLTPEQVAQLKQMRMELDFHQDGKLVLKGENNGQPYVSEAQWELVGVQGDTVTIKSIEEGLEEKLIDIRFEGKNDFTMPLKTERADIGAMKFRRLQ